MWPHTDDRCPAGHRFLLQCVEAEDETEARRQLRAVFGAERAAAAVLVRGCRLLGTGHKANSCEWKASEKGFRAYLPCDS